MRPSSVLFGPTAPLTHTSCGLDESMEASQPFEQTIGRWSAQFAPPSRVFHTAHESWNQPSVAFAKVRFFAPQFGQLVDQLAPPSVVRWTPPPVTQPRPGSREKRPSG